MGFQPRLNRFGFAISAAACCVAAAFIFQNCSQPQFDLTPQSASGGDGGAPEPGVRVIDGPIDYTLVCGAARQKGKYLDFEGNGCTVPATSDQSCDRWGCAVMINEQGDSDCPSGTDKIFTDDDPVYFLCLRRSLNHGPVANVCGGARWVGKWTRPEECNNPVTSDQTCNFWGCVVQINAQGDAACPAGKTTIRTHDGPTSILCLD